MELAKNKSWTDLAVFEDENAAKALETFLKGKKFTARTCDNKTFRALFFLNPPRALFRVQTRQADFKIAEYCLNTVPAEILQNAIHCPACDSLRVIYPHPTRHSAAATLLLRLETLFHLAHHECYCEHCHHIWNLPGENVAPQRNLASST